MAAISLSPIRRALLAAAAAFNGDPSWTLTMPARYAVTPGGTIEYADISIDYTRRGDPSELIPLLAHLAAH